jgi:hypothetical protein
MKERKRRRKEGKRTQIIKGERERESTQLQTSITKRGTQTPEVLTTTPTSFIAGDVDTTVS